MSPFRFCAIVLVLGSTITLTACGGSSSGDTSGSAAPTTVSSDQVVVSSPSDSRYDVMPDVSKCQAGHLKTAEKTEALARLNLARSLHNLPAVTYNDAWDDEMAQAALMMVAANDLTHTPATTVPCYTAAGAQGAATSDLYLTENSAGTLAESSSLGIDFFLTEYFNDSSNVESLGHRLWLLDPFLSQVAFGRVDGHPVGSGSTVMASSMKVIGGPKADLSSMTTDFVAYPYGNYPTQMFAKQFYMSFSAIADKTASYLNKNISAVDFTNAKVQVFDGTMRSVAISNLGFANNTAGLGNVLKWKVPGLSDNQTYTVKITDVKVNGVLRTYDYTYRLI